MRRSRIHTAMYALFICFLPYAHDGASGILRIANTKHQFGRHFGHFAHGRAFLTPPSSSAY